MWMLSKPVMFKRNYRTAPYWKKVLSTNATLTSWWLLLDLRVKLVHRHSNKRRTRLRINPETNMKMADPARKNPMERSKSQKLKIWVIICHYLKLTANGRFPRSGEVSSTGRGRPTFSGLGNCPRRPYEFPKLIYNSITEIAFWGKRRCLTV